MNDSGSFFGNRKVNSIRGIWMKNLGKVAESTVDDIFEPEMR